MNNFKGKNSTRKRYCHISLQINLDEHVIRKMNTFRIYKGVWGASPPEAEEFFKKSNKMEAFPYFLLFGKAPYIPKIMSLLPSSPKIITSAPQLPENK